MIPSPLLAALRSVPARPQPAFREWSRAGMNGHLVSIARNTHRARPTAITALLQLRSFTSSPNRSISTLGLRPNSPISPSPTQLNFFPNSTLLTLSRPMSKSSNKRARRARALWKRMNDRPLSLKILTWIVAYLLVSLICYNTIPPSRHFFLALVRCARLMQAVVLDVADYKWTFAQSYGVVGTEEEKQARRLARHGCHERSSKRLMEALKTNAGIYVKLGQHIASVQMLPTIWTSTFRPLQDMCYPTPIADIDDMMMRDMGMRLDDIFSDFNPIPIGVASLAQVHTAVDRRTGRRVAVKLQHPHLEEFAKIDIATVNVSMQIVKLVFPDFEFSWLADEMNYMLPLEMDFAHEAYNADRCREEFLPLKGKTSLYIPEILWAERRCMAMEYIEGARVDNLVYLKDHGIDRNKVSQELSRIFSQMIYTNGYFHADPHEGNILIRPKAATSTSPFNFDVVLLDWGQCFDVPHDLRINYAKFWLALIAKNSPETSARRRKYAKLVANINDEMYPILESAITGRMGLEESEPAEGGKGLKRKQSLLEMNRMSDEEMNQMKNALVEKEGLITSIFQLLRDAPRRLIMILKLNDLTRSLDVSLATTHGQSRVFIIVAKACSFAVWEDDKLQLLDRWRNQGLSFGVISSYICGLWKFTYFYSGLSIFEYGLDTKARLVKWQLWLKGLRERGWQGAFDASAGLAQ